MFLIKYGGEKIKKLAKSVALLLIMGMVLLLLTGCGGDKIVGTKTNENDSMFGTYEEKIEISFKDDKPDKIKNTFEFENEDKAQSAYAIFNLGVSMLEEGQKEAYQVKQSGKKVTMEMSAEIYGEQQYLNDKDMTKDALKASLEEDGYKIK